MISDVYKQKLKKEHRIDRGIFVLAALVTIAFHVLLYYLFTVPKIQSKPDIEYFTRISILDVNDSKKEAWLNDYSYADPTLLVKPNNHVGYSAICHRAKELSLFPPSDGFSYGHHQTLLDQLEIQPDAYDPVVDDLTKLNEQIDFFNYSIWVVPEDNVNPNPNPKPNPGKKDITYPQCFDSDKNPYSLLTFTDNLAKTISSENPTTKSVIRVNFEGADFMPSVTVIKSCGSLKLDILAKKTILMKYGNLNLSESKPVKTLTILWKGQQ